MGPTGIDSSLSLTERLRLSASDHDRRRLQARFAGLEMTPIVDAAQRCPIRIGGEIRSQHRSAPDDRRFLNVEITDGSGSAVLVFTGRNRIHGLQTGRALVAEGVGLREGERLVVRNPAYTLLGATRS